MKTLCLLAGGVMAVVASCGPKSEDKYADRDSALRTFLQTARTDTSTTPLRGIVVVSETGCSACNRSFASLVERHLTDPKLLFIVSAIGQQVDVSEFKSHPERVIWDYNEEFQKTRILEKSGFVLMKENHIDTAIQVEAAELENQLSFISGRLEQPEEKPRQ